MLTRCKKAYSSSCSQTVSLSPAISSQFIIVVRCSRKSQKSIKNPLILVVHGLSKSSMLIRLKSSLLVFVVTGSMPMPICNCFYERLAKNGKITNFYGGTALWCPRAQVSLNLKNRDLDHRNLRSMLKIL